MGEAAAFSKTWMTRKLEVNSLRRFTEFLCLVLHSMRPKQWIKNLFVFAPILFSMSIFHSGQVLRACLAFLLFCLLSGATYLFNDMIDRREDQNHPIKKQRPVAAGLLPIKTAAAFTMMIMAVTFLGAWAADSGFFWTLAVYALMNLAYTLWLKSVVILDVMLIAMGFVLRVVAGGQINDIPLSPWILLITFLLSIFLALVKRRQEMVRFRQSDPDLPAFRATLNQYNLPLLDQLISLSTATTLISYFMYVLNPGVKGKFHTDLLILTIPFVVFGIFRYLYLAYVNERGESPEEVVITDLPFVVNALLWLGVFLWILYA